ncbi:MAG: flagellar hook-associated protein FlgL [Cellvibrionaceae bacterium]
MRISTSQIYNIANKGINDANVAISKTQEQMSTGQRVLTPADDPVAATKIMQLNETLSRIEQYGKNVSLAENDLQLEETTLNSVNNLILRMQELAVQAGNTGVLTTNEYKALATEVDARINELMNLVNTQSANGDYIFAGYKSTQPPFVREGEGIFHYEGDQGQKNIKVSDSVKIPVTDSGKNIFMDVPSASNTISTYVDPGNAKGSTVTINIGQVVDQEVYDEFYPEDMVVTFNPDGDIAPPGKNFTITAKSSGEVLLANQPYVPGNEVIVKGVSFQMKGDPVSAFPAMLDFFPGVAPGVVTIPGSFDLTVNGVTETITLAGVQPADVEITSGANAVALQRLGIRLEPHPITGDLRLSMPEGENFTLDATASPVLDIALFGGIGSAITTNGDPTRTGDKIFIDSSDSQGLLSTLARFSDAMKNVEDNPDSKAILAELVADTLSNLTNAQVRVIETTSTIGARFNTLESTKNLHLDTDFVSREILSELQDLDYAEAASRLAAQQLVLEAAQASFVRISQLSLFSRL